MIELFRETINTEGFCNTGFIDILAMHSGGNANELKVAIRIQMGILSKPEVELVEYWKLSFDDVQANSLSIGGARNIEILENHCLLWQYEQPRQSLIINRAVNASDIDALIGRLYLKHRELVGNWMPFEISYSALMNGNALIVTAPEKLTLSYHAIFEEMGIQCSSYVSSYPAGYCEVEGWTEERKKNQLLIVDSSYIIASRVSAKRLSKSLTSF